MKSTESQKKLFLSNKLICQSLTRDLSLRQQKIIGQIFYTIFQILFLYLLHTLKKFICVKIE